MTDHLRQISDINDSLLIVYNQIAKLHSQYQELENRISHLESHEIQELSLEQIQEPQEQPFEDSLSNDAMISQESFLMLSGERPEILRRWFSGPCSRLTTLLSAVRSVTKAPIKRVLGGHNLFLTTVRTYRIVADYLSDKEPGKRVSNAGLISYAVECEKSLAEIRRLNLEP